MKIFILTLFIFVVFGFSTLAQSNFDIGFKKGFAIGYCYSNDENANYYCIPPLPPLPPLPQISESSDNYQDGYNRGFLYGLAQRRAEDNKSSSRNSNRVEPPKFNPYIQQNPIVTLTPEEREAYYAARARQDQATAEALAYLLEHIFTRTPEQKAASAEAKQQREQLRLQHEAERERIRESMRLVVGSEKYFICKKSKNIWLGSALITGTVGTFSYLQANKYTGDYPRSTTDAASVAQKADMYNSIYPVCFAAAGFCTIEFLIKTIKISKARTQPVSFYPIPVKDGAGVFLSYKF
jgi:hypothetical protein